MTVQTATSGSPHQFSSVEKLVEGLGGDFVVKKILVANNGNAAVKFIRSVREWAYNVLGDEKAFHFVAMASVEDTRANAEYIRMADDVVSVPGGSNVNNYANVDLILDLAVRHRVQAVWAGWGHASENPRLPGGLAKLSPRIKFIGPGENAMHDLGDKICSTLVAQGAGVPCIPWSGSEVEVEYKGNGVPDNKYTEACVKTEEQCEAAATKIGYPVMIKASEGGGGKGIRAVRSPETLADAFRQVRGEVPGSPIFLMRLLPAARHLEVQLLADEASTAIALRTRDCSVQRRHQKVIEEGPADVADPLVLREMEAAAVRLAESVGYVGAGTVEYLYHAQTKKYYFLELNPRLQVEHPVTEMITNVNLPACQLLVSMGIALSRIPEIRALYNQEPYATSEIDFNTSEQREPIGHVIGCRITAEDADEGFKPTSGLIESLTFRSTPNVWGYFSVAAHSALHEFADSQFGHVFSWGTSREAARRSMVYALRNLDIRGEIHTSVEYLVTLLETPEYRDSLFDTAWLDGLIQAKLVAGKPDTDVAVACGAVFTAHQAFTQMDSEFKDALGRGQAPTTLGLSDSQDFDLVYDNVKYPLTVDRTDSNSYAVKLPTSKNLHVSVTTLADGGFLFASEGQSRTVYARTEATGVRLIINGQTCLYPEEKDPTRLRTASSGKLVRFLVPDGGHCKAGQAYAEMEVMKMYLALTSDAAGTVSYEAVPGSAVESGDLLARMVLDSPDDVQQLSEFEGDFAGKWTGSAPVESEDVSHHAKVVEARVDACFSGFGACRATLACAGLGAWATNLAASFSKVLNNPDVPVAQWNAILSATKAHLPVATHAILVASGEAQAAIGSFDGAALLAVVEKVLTADGNDASVLGPILEPLCVLATTYRGGISGYAVTAVSSRLHKYLETESGFVAGKRNQEVLSEFYRDAEAHGVENPADATLALAQGHAGAKAASQLVAAILQVVVKFSVPAYTSVLGDLATLSTPEGGATGLRARHLVMAYSLPSFSQRRVGIEGTFMSAVRDPSLRESAVATLTSQEGFLYNVLMTFLRHTVPEVRTMALEVLARRTYRSLKVSQLEVTRHGATAAANSEPTDGEFLVAKFGLSACRQLPVVGSSPKIPRVESVPDVLRWANESAAPGSSEDEDQTTVTHLVFFDLDTINTAFHSAVADHGPASSCPSPVANAGSSVALSMPAVVNSLGDLESQAAGAPVSGLSCHARVVSSVREFGADDNVMALTLVPTWTPSAGDDGDVCLNLPSPEDLAKKLGGLVREHSAALEKQEVSRVTFSVCRCITDIPEYYTFRAPSFSEDVLHRHIDPPHAHELELARLSHNYQIRRVLGEDRTVGVFHGTPRHNNLNPGGRFFLRVVVRREGGAGAAGLEFLKTEGEKTFLTCLDQLEVAMSQKKYVRADCASVMLSVLPEIHVEHHHVVNFLRTLCGRHASRLLRLRVTNAEIRVLMRSSPDSAATAVRFEVSNPTGYALTIHSYMEVKDVETATTILAPLDRDAGPRAKQCVDHPYPPMSPLQARRARALALGSAFAYDYPSIIHACVASEWASAMSNGSVPSVEAPPSFAEMCVVRELVVDDNSPSGLIEVTRAPGLSPVGMVGFRITLRSPAYPSGRDIVVIANDITVKVGSFGPLEDELFFRCSRLARTLSLPRLYFSCNSGARIGVATEIRDHVRAAWVDPARPDRGFEYLYLSPEDNAIHGAAVNTSAVEVSSETGVVEIRHKLTDIIGTARDLGVENLRMSGKIAGETSAAYKETFTLTVVTGRSVGIGAYLVRLGHRTIQVSHAPIILTGAGALNKVLNSDVYHSNAQLGGPRIMGNNGISHLVVPDDRAAVVSSLQWLSYVRPADVVGCGSSSESAADLQSSPSSLPAPAPLATAFTADPVDRDVAPVPEDKAYDPRVLFSGRVVDGKFAPGLVDKGSFVEYMAHWAQSVVVGRARIGGIPVGVITPEIRSTTTIVPADAAIPESRETSVVRAGSVWYPDSSHKTASAIRDFGNGECLPLIILANWRGFSGGMRDMYDSILKFGSMIVDHLRVFKQPVLVYIPPRGELRGGAWVVVDPTINPDHMVMLADPSARGGVLEPSGVVEIKFKRKTLVVLMERLDDEYRLHAQGSRDPTASPEERSVAKEALMAREKLLLPVYRGLATTFCDLHDTTGRMMAVGAVQQSVAWKDARRVFHAQIRSRLAVDAVAKRLMNHNSNLKLADARAVVRQNHASASSGAPTTTTAPSATTSSASKPVRMVTETLNRLKSKMTALASRRNSSSDVTGGASAPGVGAGSEDSAAGVTTAPSAGATPVRSGTVTPTEAVSHAAAALSVVPEPALDDTVAWARLADHAVSLAGDSSRMEALCSAVRTASLTTTISSMVEDNDTDAVMEALAQALKSDPSAKAKVKALLARM